MNFWVSWWHADEFSPFELHSPWWITGSRNGAITICAAVRARDWERVTDIIGDAYDEVPTHLEVRFIEEMPDDWSPFSDRFPKSEWMQW